MKRLIACAALMGAMVQPVLAQLRVDDPWVRATVPQQRATGAFMRLTSAVDARLVSISSPVAEVAEVHEMNMVNDVMKMRAVAALELPAGRTVELQPGGLHVMLINLKAPVKEGDAVPLTLVVEGRDGKRESIDVQATVMPLNQARGPSMQMHGQDQKH